MTDDDLIGRFGAIDQQFERVHERLERVDERLERVDERLERVDERFERMETLIREEGEATRRHFDVVAEAMKLDIKIVADGHAALQGDVTVLKTRQHRLEGRQENLEVRQLALESRQRKLEGNS